MLKLRKVAVTGDVASGKTSVCRFLRDCGAIVVSADQIVHNLYNLLSPNSNLGKKIVSLLGEEVIENNQFNRKAIAHIVFKNYELLYQLEQLIHPEVQNEIENAYCICKKKLSDEYQSGTFLFVAEVPLLFEAGLDKFYEEIILVTADPISCQKRYLKRHPNDREGYFERSKRFIDQNEKLKKAQWIIANDSNLEKLKCSTEILYEQLTQKNHH